MSFKERDREHVWMVGNGQEKNHLVKVSVHSVACHCIFMTYFLWLCLTPTVVQCPSLSSPSNGRVRVSGRTPGSEARYSCNEGYQLEGSVTRRCLNEGVWSSQEPICIGMCGHTISLSALEKHIGACIAVVFMLS